MSVYVMRAGRHFKIGYTAGDPRKRQSSIQTSSAVPVYLLGVIDGTTEDEKRLHRQFAGQRLAGEWFSLSWADVGAILDRAVEEADPGPAGPDLSDVMSECWYPAREDKNAAEFVEQLRLTWPDGADYLTPEQMVKLITRPHNWWGIAFGQRSPAGFLQVTLTWLADIPPRTVKVNGQAVTVFARADFPWAQNASSPTA